MCVLMCLFSEELAHSSLPLTIPRTTTAEGSQSVVVLWVPPNTHHIDKQ